MHNRKTRNKIYKEMLNQALCMEKYHGLCNFLIISQYKFKLLKLEIYYYPELIKHKTPCPIRETFAFWFPQNLTGYRKRIDIIKQAIKETE